MKIYLQDLCLQLKVREWNPSYEFPFVSWERVREWDEQPLFEGQTLHLKVANLDTWTEELFEWQKNRIYHHYKARLVFYFENQTVLMRAFLMFRSYFKVETAAGGLVQNQQNEILFIYIRQRWTLPKGHVEEDETISVAALREVQEETGLNSLKIYHLLDITFHLFYDERKKKKWRWKDTYWYNMTGDEQEKLTAQIEEGIEDVKWVSLENLQNKSYPNFPMIESLIRGALFVVS